MHDDVESSYESRDSSGKENVKDAGSPSGESGEPGTEPCIPLFVREGEAAAGRMNAANLRNASNEIEAFAERNESSFDGAGAEHIKNNLFL